MSKKNIKKNLTFYLSWTNKFPIFKTLKLFFNKMGAEKLCKNIWGFSHDQHFFFSKSI